MNLLWVCLEKIFPSLLNLFLLDTPSSTESTPLSSDKSEPIKSQSHTQSESSKTKEDEVTIDDDDDDDSMFDEEEFETVNINFYIKIFIIFLKLF